MRIRFWSILMMLAFGVIVSSSAVEQNYHFENVQQQRIFKELTQELRCPRCQNQNIADSNATIALDMKNKVYELVSQGKSKQYTIDFMKQRYGEFVHYQPPFNAITMFLWLIPLIFVVGGLWLVFRRKTDAQDNSNQGSVSEAKKLLERDKC